MAADNEESLETKTTETSQESDLASIEVKASRPHTNALMYCDFQVDTKQFKSEEEAISFIETTLAGKYSSIKEFNHEVDEITWNVKGDSELHNISMLQLRAKKSL
jgi:hypothetical protein